MDQNRPQKDRTEEDVSAINEKVQDLRWQLEEVKDLG